MECTKCRVTLCEKNWKTRYYDKNKHYPNCKHCHNKSSRCYYKFNTEELEQLSIKNSNHINNKLFTNTEEWKKYKVKKDTVYNKKQRKLLSDSYIRHSLYSNSNIDILNKDITPELIEVKRNQIILKRWLKQTSS